MKSNSLPVFFQEAFAVTGPAIFFIDSSGLRVVDDVFFQDADLHKSRFCLLDISKQSITFSNTGRSCRINLAFRDDKRYMSAYQLAKTGNIVGTAFLYNEVQNDLDPFDYETFNANPTRLYAVVSDVMFGQPDYIEITSLPEKLDYVRASASLPVVSRMVDIDGRLLLDGGTTDSVPLKRALAEPGNGKAVVVLTQ